MSKTPPRLKPAHYFRDHPIFTLEEFAASEPARPIATVRAVLAHHVRAGNLVRIRRGLYRDAELADPFLVASRLAPDAVLAYDGALPLHLGSVLPDVLEGRISFLTTARRARLEDSEDLLFNAVRPPRALGAKWREGVVTQELSGLEVHLTSYERTLVDLLVRQDLAPPLASLWELFVHRPGDPELMLRHARALGSRVLAARLGVFLEHLPHPPKSVLERLEKLRPRSPVYFDRSRRDGEKTAYLSRWNLVAPFMLWATLSRTDYRGSTPIIPRLEAERIPTERAHSRTRR